MDNKIERTEKAVNNAIPFQELAVDVGTNNSSTTATNIGRTGEQYSEHINTKFVKSKIGETTILVSGVTLAQDRFFTSALRGAGYHVNFIGTPDNEALQFGKEFGNRGQCNPTYFTVGNLVKHLVHLRDVEGIPTQEILDNYLYVTAGACGPCRFGTYVTEYRKALRDAGFDGFRVLSASQTGGMKQATGDGDGISVTPKLFVRTFQSIVIGDILNALMYRIRPYEVNEGETNEKLEECRQIIERAFEDNKSMFSAVLKVRKILKSIKVDRTQVKPKVSIIGEFWAMTTEGDGNYHLQKFLESEGAEVDIQLLTAWALYMIWQVRYDTMNRSTLKQADDSKRGLVGVSIKKRMTMMWAAEKALKGTFQFYANLMGLKGYHFPDMDEIAKVSQEFYDNDNRGGEGHMEVGKLILNAKKNKVNMTLSVKPFGCMPSSGVSDGVQSKITEKYPEAIFLPIETTGDGAVNVYSRIQMQLFKAKQQAHKEFDKALEKAGLAKDALAKLKSNEKVSDALHYSPHSAACTSASLINELA